MDAPDETRDQRAERLAPTAAAWAARLRDEDVDTLAAELLDPLPRRDLYGLIGLLGGAADPSVPASVWWGWVRFRDALATAEPIRWAEDELRIEDMTTAEINDLMWQLREEDHMQYKDIAHRVQLDPAAVSKRLELMRKARAEAEEEGKASRVEVAG